MESAHDRIGLLIGHKIPEGRTCEEGRLIGTGHETDGCSGAIIAQKKIQLMPVRELRKRVPKKAVSVVSAT